MQPIIPPERLGIFLPDWGMPRRSIDEFRFFLKHEHKNLIVISPMTDGPQRARLPIPHTKRGAY